MALVEHDFEGESEPREEESTGINLVELKLGSPYGCSELKPFLVKRKL